MGPVHDAAVRNDVEWFRTAISNGENIHAPNDVRVPYARHRSLSLVIPVSAVFHALAAAALVHVQRPHSAI